jgi:aspartate/methionine/tyrosine aminotransferase
MPNPADAVNRVLEREVPALFASLSPLGRRVVFPPDIPFQAAQARGKPFNATIGQITDGAGGAMALPSIAAPLGSLNAPALDRALLYSPVEGFPEVRRAWRDWQRRNVDAAIPSTLPIVVDGLTHGLSLLADLFGGGGRSVVVPAPYWGNYKQTFATRTGAGMVATPAYRDGRYDVGAIAHALAELAGNDPAIVMLNFPSNPGGYSLTDDEREQLVENLTAAAADRPLVVICDDAYSGLVYDETISRASLFWQLIGAHPNLVPIKVDGATKEFSMFGARVGFVTFGVDPASAAAAALESKAKCLVRATVGSPVALSQVLLLQALRSPTVGEEVEAVRRELGRRWEILTAALVGVDRELLQPLPCNSGCFALLALPSDVELEAERVRTHLLDSEDLGLIAIAPNFLRIAFCSVAAEALPELVERLERGVAAAI